MSDLDTLLQSFGGMGVSAPPPRQYGVTSTSLSTQFQARPQFSPIDCSQPSRPAQYPMLPDGYESHPRHYVLGWAVSDDWLEEFARRHYPGSIKREPDWVCLGGAQLQRMSGFRHLYLVNALHDGAPAPASAHDSRSPLTLLLMVSHTASDELLRRRPTQAQYDWLVQVFGEEPRWYRDGLPKNHLYHVLHTTAATWELAAAGSS